MVYAPGYALAHATLDKSGNVITLKPDATISGTVTDTEGKPLAGVPIRLRMIYCAHDLHLGYFLNAVVPEAWRARFTASTAADGSWSLPGIPRTALVWLVLDGEQYVHEEQTVVLIAGETAKPVHFTAHPGATVTGRILTQEGTPVVGAHLFIYAQNRDSSTSTYSEGKTAADGSYRFDGMETGNYTLDVCGEHPWIAEPLENITLVEGQTIAAPELRTRPGAVLSGRILTPDGSPATDALVSITTTDNSRKTATSGNAKTAADGRYRIAGLATGSYTLNASSEDAAWVAAPLKQITLTEGKETAAAELRAHLGTGLEGTVVDAETGKPIAGRVCVWLYNGTQMNNSTQRIECWTEPHGHFFVRTSAGKWSLRLARLPYGYPDMPATSGYAGRVARRQDRYRRVESAQRPDHHGYGRRCRWQTGARDVFGKLYA